MIIIDTIGNIIMCLNLNLMMIKHFTKIVLFYNNLLEELDELPQLEI